MEVVDSNPARLPGATLGDRAAGHLPHQLADGGADLIRHGHGDEETARAGRIVLWPNERPAPTASDLAVTLATVLALATAIDLRLATAVGVRPAKPRHREWLSVVIEPFLD
jgi:hypothetical protein